MRIAVVSDVHSNIDALDAVLSHAKADGGFDALWCTGDIVGYGAEPAAVIDVLRRRNAVAVAGNHDLAVCGEMDLDEFNPVAAEAVRWTQQHLSEDGLAYLRALPLVVQSSERMILVHGSLRSPQWEYLLDADQAAAQFDVQPTRYSIVGHSHLQFVMEQQPNDDPRIAAAQADVPMPLGEAKLILNPGSVGQPRDGDPRAGYMLYDDAAATVTWHRVEYDVEAAQRRIVAAGLPPYLGARLLAGR